jgi:hypothetical protein
MKKTEVIPAFENWSERDRQKQATNLAYYQAANDSEVIDPSSFIHHYLIFYVMSDQLGKP